MYTFWYVDMPDKTASYGGLSDLNAFFKNYYMFETLYFYQTFTDSNIKAEVLR